jgi:hypothetical protein
MTESPEEKQNINDFYITAAAAGVKPVDFLENCSEWSGFVDKKNFDISPLRGGNFRFLIISMGPKGSGKSGTTEATKRYASLINNNAVRNGKPWVEENVNYDHLIMHNVDYKSGIKKLVPSFEEDTVQKVGKNPEQIKNIEALYNQVRNDNATPIQKKQRKSYGFGSKKRKAALRRLGITDNMGNLKTVDIQIYGNLRKAIVNGKNIVYETTGANWDTLRKIFETIVFTTNTCQKFKYIILGSLNIIDSQSLQKRILGRSRNSLKQMVTFPTTAPAARFPKSDLENINKCREKIYNNIKHLINMCTTTDEGASETGTCQGVGVDILLIYDQGRVDLRKQENPSEDKIKMNWSPDVVVPLSVRSKYITKYTQNKSITFSPTSREKLGQLFEGKRNEVPDTQIEDLFKTRLHKMKLRRQMKTALERTTRKGGRRPKSIRKTKKTRRRRKKKTRKKTKYS